MSYAPDFVARILTIRHFAGKRKIDKNNFFKDWHAFALQRRQQGRNSTMLPGIAGHEFVEGRKCPPFCAKFMNALH